MAPITSRQNPIVARFRAAARGDVADVLLLDGAHLVTDAVDAGLVIREVAVDAEARDRAEIAAITGRLEQLDVPVVTAAASVMSALSPVRSPSHIVAIADRPIRDDTHVYQRAGLIVVAIDVQDPGNLGAVVRVAEAAGATGLACAGACADPFGWKALRGSMGSALRLPILMYPNSNAAIDEARRHRHRIIATAPRNGRPLVEVDLTGPVAVLIGSEGQGLSSSQLDAADERITIPMQPPVESLNAATAAAVIVYEAQRQRRLHAAPGANAAPSRA